MLSASLLPRYVPLAATFLTVAAGLSSSSYGPSSGVVVDSQEWFSRLQRLVNQNVSCLFEAGPHDVLLKSSVEPAWFGKAPLSCTWTDYSSTNVKGLDLPAKDGGVIVSSMNAYGSGQGAFNARFTVDGDAPFSDRFGTFYQLGIDGHDLPFNFVQMTTIPCGRPSHQVNLRLQTMSPEWQINGAGHTAALLPPPVFLSSLQSPLFYGSAPHRPFDKLVHGLEVSSGRALLIMAANGRIKGTDGETSLTFTVDGYSATGQYDRDYGFYHVTANATSQSFIHMGIYQLAEVGSGSHTVRLQDQGAEFDLRYATSQVAVIPVDTVQLKTVSAEWTMTLAGGSMPILSTSAVATEDSLLTMASTFEVGSECGEYHVYVQFKVDGKLVHQTLHDPLVAYGAFHINIRSNSSFPASMLQFTEVRPGNHQIELYASRPGKCAPIVKRAVLQVALIPQSL